MKLGVHWSFRISLARAPVKTFFVYQHFLEYCSRTFSQVINAKELKLKKRWESHKIAAANTFCTTSHPMCQPAQTTSSLVPRLLFLASILIRFLFLRHRTCNQLPVKSPLLWVTHARGSTSTTLQNTIFLKTHYKLLSLGLLSLLPREKKYLHLWETTD